MRLQSRTDRLIKTLSSENETMRKKIKWIISNAKDLDSVTIKAELSEMMKELGYEL